MRAVLEDVRALLIDLDGRRGNDRGSQTAFGYDVLNHDFRQVMDGAQLIALQKDRYRTRANGPSLDVGPFVVAIEFAESDISGAPRAELNAILVRTGKTAPANPASNTDPRRRLDRRHAPPLGT